MKLKNPCTHRIVALGLALGASILVARAAAPSSPQGVISGKAFTGISGTAVTDLTTTATFPGSPDEVMYLPYFEWNATGAIATEPGDWGDNYGTQIIGYFYPPVTGDYFFAIAADDNAELYLSTDDDPANKKLIAREDDYSDPREYITSANSTVADKTSETFTGTEWPTLDPAFGGAKITLQASQPYYIEALHKEGGGGDNLSVSVLGAGIDGNRPIPGQYLSSDKATGPTAIVLHPQSQTVDEGASVTFRVDADGTPPYTLQWTQDGADITGASAQIYTIAPALFTDNGSAFACRVTGPGGSATSNDAILTVNQDTIAPTLVSARGGSDRVSLTVVFSEVVNATSATDLANYSVSPAMTLSDPQMSDPTTVVFTTAQQTLGTEYTLTVNGVTDIAATPNPIPADSQAVFYGVGHLLQDGNGFVIWETEDYDRNLDELWIKETARGPASGGASMLIPNGAGGGEGTTKLEYDVVFTKTGTHILWYRAGADAGEDDSAWFHLDGARPPERDPAQTPGAPANAASMAGFNGAIFEWNSSPQDGGGQMTFQIDAIGVHSIAVARREDGAFFDKFIITTDPNFNPDDYGAFGPPATPREGEPPPAGADIEITLQPVDAEGVEGGSASVTADATVAGGAVIVFQWQREQGGAFADIPGETGGTLTIDPLTLDWNGAVVRMRVTAGEMTAYTDSATITVSSDVVPPEIVRASGVADTGRVIVDFSEPLDLVTAQAPGNYAIAGPAGDLSISAVTLLPSGQSVLLETGAQTVGTKYTVTVDGVRDTAQNPNTLVNGQAKFYSLGDLLAQTPEGLLVFEAESYNRNLDGLWIEDALRPGASGGVSVVIPNGSSDSESATQLQYDLTFTQTGTHFIHYRAGSDSGSDDSAWLHVDGARPPERDPQQNPSALANAASMSGFNGVTFAWFSSPQDGDPPYTFDIGTPGAHVIALAAREDGAYFDKFVITTDPAFDPTAFGPMGPPETRAGAPALPSLAITSPVSESQFAPGTDIDFTVEISATTRVVSQVEFYAGTNLIGVATASPYNFTLPSAPTGGYVVTARLVDDVNDIVQSQPVLLTVGDPNDILFVVGDPDLGNYPGDTAIQDHLAGFGFNVVLADDNLTRDLDAYAKELIVVSSTVGSGNVNIKFRDAAVPVLSWEGLLQDDFGMTGDVDGTDLGDVVGLTDLEIVNAGHPMAAGFPAGQRTVLTTPTDVGFGVPNENAVVIASVPGVPDQALIYGYDTGTTLVDGSLAPARRVELFLSDDAFPALNEDGVALFDAALSWALDRELIVADQLVVSASFDAGNLTLDWTGATGPVLVQKKATLNDADWEDVTTTSDSSVTLPIEGNAGFFRVQEP